LLCLVFETSNESMEFEQFAQNGKRNSEWIVGVKVRIKTTLGEELEGEIFSYDTTTNCAVLVQNNVHSTLKKSYRILKTSFIKEISYLGKAEVNEADITQLPAVNISKIRLKEEAVLRSLREEAARIGVGVSEEAQENF